MARGAVPDSHALHLGMPGHARHRRGGHGAAEVDLLITLGARFDDRVTGQLSTFAPGAKVIHADIDPAEISKNRAADVPIVGDCRGGHRDLIAALQADMRPAATRRLQSVARAGRGAGRRRSRSATPHRRRHSAPQYVIERIGAISGPEAIYVAGVGQHQMWAAQFVQYERPNSWINSGGLGTMGFCVPAAMGAKVGQPERTVWAIDGDGCFQMTNQELATCVINNIPIKVAIINNSSLGMVRQWQTLFYNERYSNTDLHTGASSGCLTSSSWPRPTAASDFAASRRTTSTRPSSRPWRSTTSRSWSTSSSTATRWCGRWSPPASATTRSRSPAARPPSAGTAED